VVTNEFCFRGSGLTTREELLVGRDSVYGTVTAGASVSIVVIFESSRSKVCPDVGPSAGTDVDVNKVSGDVDGQGRSIGVAGLRT
jgi:hypothetical protein